jgi:hypothetical protein
MTPRNLLIIAQVAASGAYGEAMKSMGYSVPARQPTDFGQLMKSGIAAWSEWVGLAKCEAADQVLAPIAPTPMTASFIGDHLARSVRGVPGAPPATAVPA